MSPLGCPLEPALVFVVDYNATEETFPVDLRQPLRILKLGQLAPEPHEQGQEVSHPDSELASVRRLHVASLSELVQLGWPAVSATMTVARLVPLRLPEMCAP